MAHFSSALITLACLLVVQLSSISTQSTADLNNLPPTSGILVAIEASAFSGQGIDERTAEDIRTAFSSPSVSALLNSSSSSSTVSQYFFEEANTSDPIKMLQGINSLYVIKVMYDIANRIQSTNATYWSKIRIVWSPMQKNLDDFFNQTSFPQTAGSQVTSTPLFVSALNVTPSFALENNPLLSNLTVDNTVPNVTECLFALARIVSVARQLSALINITTDGELVTVLNDNLRNFQRTLYTVNALTNYELVDQITELNFLPFISPPKATTTTTTTKRNKNMKRRSLKKRNIQKRL